jgi:hypothetical protein
MGIDYNDPEQLVWIAGIDVLTAANALKNAHLANLTVDDLHDIVQALIAEGYVSHDFL